MRHLLSGLALMGAMALPFAAGAAELGDDGLHKQPWFTVTFKDVGEDLADANDAGKNLALIFEQRGCIYCKKMHEETFSNAELAEYISENFMVVQYNYHGDEEVTDLDGEVLPEKDIARRWGVMFTPSILFIDPDADDEMNAKEASVAVMPGAFGKGTTRDLFTWVREKGYEGAEDFQRYHARKIQERMAENEKAGTD